MTRPTCITELAAWALRYIANDWPVVPLYEARDGRCACGRADCDSPGKHPRTEHGLKDASTDADTIHAWWSRWPSASVAIRTGRISGLLVIDMDPRHDGAASLERLQAEHGALPETLRVHSGGGGTHLYFRLPAGVVVPNSSGRLGAGLDVKGENGMIVAPPSTHVSGGQYRWVTAFDERGIAEAPRWLLGLLARDERRQQNRTRTHGHEVRGNGQLIREGERNQELTRIAGRLRGGGLDVPEIEATLLAVNARRCSPPLPQDEVRHIAQSVGRYPAGRQHGAAPEDPPTVVDRLIGLAEKLYRLGQDEAGDPFAVPRAGPNIALPLSGCEFRARLARAYRQRFGKAPSRTVLDDAVNTLAGAALDAPRETLALRSAPHQGTIIIDLGRSDGQVVQVRPGGWELLPHSPVLFRRTALTGEMPLPERGGTLEELRQVLNVGDEDWPLVTAWLVAALMPQMPCPILLLGGEAGSGKTSSAKAVTTTIDASPAPLRSEPRDADQWAVTAAGSWCIAIDNVSGISGWWSDAMCRAVTGDAWVRRRLYTNSELSVSAFRRRIVLTSIDAGALRGDLGDRLLLIELHPIEDEQRRDDVELTDAFESARPRILAALLDQLAQVLERLPHVRLTVKPRMSDFARVVQAVDPSGTALATYLGQRRRIAEQVIEGDAVALGIRDLLDGSGGRWAGSARQLLNELTAKLPGRPPHGWPDTPRGMAGRLKRLRPAFAKVGIDIVYERRPGGERERIYTLHKERADTVPTVPTVPRGS